MALINEHYLKLTKNYLFADIAKKVNAFKVSHQKANVISLGIGDVTRPLCPAVIKAMHKAVDEMSTREGFHGYGPEQGYMFLREAIVKNDYLRAAYISTRVRCSSTTVQRATRATLANWCAGTTTSALPIRYIPYMSTLT